MFAITRPRLLHIQLFTCKNRTGQAVKQDEISKLADNVLDTAYEQTQQAGDLPHIRWGRIDYLNVTRLTTKWAIWQCVSNSTLIS
jgi:hypothetical protein